MITPHDIVTEARTWLGTRFHHQGRIKATAHHKGGCDCLGLVVGVASSLGLLGRDGGLLAAQDTQGYSRSPDGGKLQSTLAQALHEIAVEAIKPADVLLFRFEHEPQHVGMVSNYNDDMGLIHCYASARKAVEHRLDALWHSRMVAAYRFHDLF